MPVQTTDARHEGTLTASADLTRCAGDIFDTHSETHIPPKLIEVETWAGSGWSRDDDSWLDSELEGKIDALHEIQRGGGEDVDEALALLYEQRAELHDRLSREAAEK